MDENLLVPEVGLHSSLDTYPEGFLFCCYRYIAVSSPLGICYLLRDARGRQTYQLTASAIVTGQPDATADILTHIALHCTLRRGFRASALA